ncbi:LacI family DNA-binding transcriptional regulator [Dinoroseobacter sp. S124A]|uniref:LacI family DNA-binding transcriptional regulator n=1 Tax=Dinoroseobacter sp. S124A TaxID=3415128 RepID=UPI003C7DABE5
MVKKIGTIRAVARDTGLSTATVSRVMNGNPKVNPEMRTRVLEAAKRLNYVPNPAARALSTAKSKTIAAIIPSIEHSVYAKYITAVEHTLSGLGYTLVLAISNADLEQELNAAEQLIAMGAEAFILTGADHNTDLMDLLNLRAKPVVFTSVFDAACGVPTVGYDNRQIAFDAVTFLQDHGHERIAVVHGPHLESDRTVSRCKGVLDAYLGKIQPRFVDVTLSVEGGRDAARDILKASQRPTAILCLSDVLALGVMFHLQSVGMTIPDDMSVMGFDNLDWAKESHPSLTTIDLPATKMGQVAAESVVARLEKGSTINSVALPAQIIPRKSVMKTT